MRLKGAVSATFNTRVRAYSNLVQGRPLTTIDDLPPVILQCILDKLPSLVERVRCALIAKRWSSLLNEPAFWAHLDFRNVTRDVTSDVLLQICQRAAGQLRVLDLSGPASPQTIFWRRDQTLFEPSTDGGGLFERLESLTYQPGSLGTLRSGADARLLRERIRERCPALVSVGPVSVEGAWQDAAAALCELPAWVRVGRATVFAVCTDPANPTPPVQHQHQQQTAPGFAAFAIALASGLARCRVDTLVLPSGKPDDFQTLFDRTAASNRASADAAAATLGAALASPAGGPRVVLCKRGGRLQAGQYTRTPPFVADMCRELSADSPLRELRLQCRDTVSSLRDNLCAALAPGRGRLATLELGGGFVMSGSWRVRDSGRPPPSPRVRTDRADRPCACLRVFQTC